MKDFIQADSLFEALFDKMAGWLRKSNANPLGSASVVSNTMSVMLLIGVMVKVSRRKRNLLIESFHTGRQFI